LLLRNRDGGEEGFLRRCVRQIALNFGPYAVQKRIAEALSRLASKRRAPAACLFLDR